MAETDEVTTEAVEKEARGMGWSPKEEWKGNPEKWIDAETFVKRGHEIMPILRENNKRQQKEIETLRGELSGLKKLFTDSQDAIKALKEFNSTTTLTEAKRTKDEIKEAIKKAKTDGDIDTEVQLTDQLSEVNTVIKAAEKEGKTEKVEKKPKDEPVDYTKDPVFIEWQGRNDWYGTDKRRTRLANMIAEEMRMDSETKELVGKAFLDRLSEEVEITIAERAGGGSKSSKVEGSRGGRGNGEDGGKGGKGYTSLPADAKAYCEKMTARLVGEGRAYKTVEDWRKAYTAKYYEGEQ